MGKKKEEKKRVCICENLHEKVFFNSQNEQVYPLFLLLPLPGVLYPEEDSLSYPEEDSLM